MELISKFEKRHPFQSGDQALAPSSSHNIIFPLPPLSTIESIEYSTPQSKLRPRFSKSGMSPTESGSDSTMFDLRLVPKFNQTT